MLFEYNGRYRHNEIVKTHIQVFLDPDVSHKKLIITHKKIKSSSRPLKIQTRPYLSVKSSPESNRNAKIQIRVFKLKC